MSEPAPRVSVVVPAYDCERYIAETVDAVLAQTAGDFELVVSDNSSDDATADILSGYRDDRIRYLRHEGHIGAVPNWNRGMAEARGRYVKLLCADDVLYPTCLERQAAVLDDPGNAGVTLVTAPRDVIDENGRRIMARGFRAAGLVPGRTAVRRVARSGTNLVGEPASTMFRAEAYRAAGPWAEDARYVVDLEMWMRLLLLGDLYVVGETLSAFRVQRGSWSNELKHLQTADFKAMLAKLAADPTSGVSKTDAFLGTLGAWRNARMRRVFYRLFLRGEGAVSRG